MNVYEKIAAFIFTIFILVISIVYIISYMQFRSIEMYVENRISRFVNQIENTHEITRDQYYCLNEELKAVSDFELKMEHEILYRSIKDETGTVDEVHLSYFENHIIDIIEKEEKYEIGQEDILSVSVCVSECNAARIIKIISGRCPIIYVTAICR